MIAILYYITISLSIKAFLLGINSLSGTVYLSIVCLVCAECYPLYCIAEQLFVVNLKIVATMRHLVYAFKYIGSIEDMFTQNGLVLLRFFLHCPEIILWQSSMEFSCMGNEALRDMWLLLGKSPGCLCMLTTVRISLIFEELLIH